MAADLLVLVGIPVVHSVRRMRLREKTWQTDTRGMPADDLLHRLDPRDNDAGGLVVERS